MKIDFTAEAAPKAAAQLSQWRRDTEAEAANLSSRSGATPDQIDAEYELSDLEMEVTFGTGFELNQEIRIAKATVRPDGILKSMRLNTPWTTPESVASIVSKLAKQWNLVAFDPASAQGDDGKPAALDAIAALQDWVLKPSDGLPAYVAETKTPPSSEIVLLRIMILPQLSDDRGLFCVSVQAFWVLEQNGGEENDDPGFSERINEVVLLANKQAENTPVNQVTDSLVYAAARYAAFAHWTAFQDPTAFDQSKQQFIENCVQAFQAMLTENLEEHQEMFE